MNLTITEAEYLQKPFELEFGDTYNLWPVAVQCLTKGEEISLADLGHYYRDIPSHLVKRVYEWCENRTIEIEF